MIRVIRETHEAPASIQRRVAHAGGFNRLGEPNFRVVWGGSRLAWIGGRWTDRDAHGNVIREAIELRRSPKYFPQERWHIERWLPPEAYGSPEMWRTQTTEIEDGISIPALGPYPSRGDYEHCFTLASSHGDALDLGDNRRFPFTISAREIAEDLLQDLNDHGVFVCAGARPTADELSAATARRDGYYHRLIAEGDTLWARGHSFREISDMHRRAAIALGVEREWAYVPTRTTECPACGEKIKQGVAVCKHCHAILDPEKAAKHGIHHSIERASYGHGAEAAAAARVPGGDQPGAKANQKEGPPEL